LTDCLEHLQNDRLFLVLLNSTFLHFRKKALTVNVCKFEFTKANSDKDGNDRANSDQLCEQLQWSMVQQLSCTCQRQMSHNFRVTHLHFFCIHKTKWKVSKDDITQLHEYSELHVRNNFENSKNVYKAEQQRQAVVQTRYMRTACINRVMIVRTVSWPWLHYCEACQKQADFT